MGNIGNENKENKNEIVKKLVNKENKHNEKKKYVKKKLSPLQKKIKIIPLGGLGEIGKNMTAFEYKDEIIVIDCGLAFPDEDLYGIDMVIPDITYLVKNKSKVKGILITHGHEDHIGALPYILKQINVPVYGTKLTLGLIETKLEDHEMLKDCTLTEVKPTEIIEFENFKAEFIRNNHSIADSCSIALHTPMGIIVHTGDFKIDFTPIDNEVIDLQRLAQLGKQGVLLLMADSTNALHKGYTMSEKTVGETLENLFGKASGRIIVSTFASNVHRLQQISNCALKYNRKIAFSGRSMEKISEVARRLGYLHIPEDMIISLEDINNYPNDRITIVTTGSQGESMAALTRIASSTHRYVQIEKGDMVIISASPIPGNEKAVSNVINDLTEKGANVIYKSIEEIHVSGHACEQELRLMQALLKPKFFIPVHGEFKHLMTHGRIAESMGVDKDNIFMLEVGDIFELTRKSGVVTGKVPSGRVLIDGMGIGDVGNMVLRDRKNLAEHGMITVVVAIDRRGKSIVCGPDIISRGFVYVRDSEVLMKDIKDIVRESVYNCLQNNITQWAEIKNSIRREVDTFIYKKMKKKPMILPVIVEL
ncbi:ribonuclease J [Clostridium butyricum]|uniref:ribonuclease J n=1 Tax=Clostridium butyricum TaxID=1492 RepID=UPI000542E12A|nr:ribonuclease J [Clostridium butyricum]KHD13357.1 ribonuclease J [Clostridium butyricum]KHD15960.1 ribonuclease J [Clostridium butyricum]